MAGRPPDKLDRIVADARRAADREQGYREQALKIYPWICGRCAREFTRANLRELTVHHRDHNHDNNPPDGSNWELLCLYCHDNEHQRSWKPPDADTAPAMPAIFLLIPRKEKWATDNYRQPIYLVGWLMGLEPTTAGITIRDSTN
jgi:hypothetical protein